jgi:GT2 family glycosyltransferase
VIDNAPSDESTKDIVASMHEVRYVQETRPGLDFARNRALCEASGDLIAFLDDDVTVDSGWLSGLVEAWAENMDAAAFTGLVLPFELAYEAQVLFEQRGGFRRGFEKIRYGHSLPGNSVYPCGPGIFGTGCNMAFRRDTLIQLGGFDEALDTGRSLPGGGDLDIFYRIIRAGYTLVYEPNFLVFHEHRHDLTGLRRQYWSWGLGLMAFISKTYRQDRSQRRKLVYLIVWWFQDMVRQLAESLLGRHTLPVGMVWAELWGGVVGLSGEYARSVKRVEQIRAQRDIGRTEAKSVL